MLFLSPSHSINTDPNEGRVVYLDVLRFFATLGVIYLHVSAAEYDYLILTQKWYISLIGDSLVRWVVPVFVMISGALFLHPEKVISHKDLYKKYIWRLLKAYLFWYLFYVVFFLFVDYHNNREIIITKTTFEPALHLWFLPMIIGVYSLIPILKRISVDRIALVYSIALWLTYISISFFISCEIPQISPLFVMNIIIGYAGYFILGYFLSEYSFVISNNLFLLCICLFSIVITVFGNLSFSIKYGISDTTFFNNLSPHIALLSSAIFLLIKNNTFRLSSYFLRIIRNTQKDLFGVYLIHWFWLFILNRDCLRNLCNPLLSFPLISVFIFILSIFTTRMIKSISYLKMIV